MDYIKLKEKIITQLEKYDQGECDWKDLPIFLTDIVKEENESFPLDAEVKHDFCKHKLEILFTEGFNIINALSIHLTEDETRSAKNLLRKKYKELTA